MTELFMQQNRQMGKKINHSYFYFCGPDYTYSKTITNDGIVNNPLDTTNVLLGVLFDYSLKIDEDDNYFRIVADLLVTQEANNHHISIDYIVGITDICIEGNQRFFAIPVDLGFPLIQVRSITLNSANIEMYNPDPKCEYTVPTSFSTGGEYIAVTTDIYMENKWLNGYVGTIGADLFNVDIGRTALLPDFLKLPFGTNDLTIQSFYTSWIKRSDLISGSIHRKFYLTCSDKGGMSYGKNMVVDYSVKCYDINGGNSEPYGGYENIEIPISTGETSSTDISTTSSIDNIPERCDYIIFGISTIPPENTYKLV